MTAEGQDLTPSVRSFLFRKAAAGVDKALLSAMMTDDRIPSPCDLEPVMAEVAAVAALHEELGYTTDPASYHVDGGAPGTVECRSERHLNVRYERVSFDSGFEPHPRNPARSRWMARRSNRTATAWVMRHRDDRPRPWLICLHGLGMGSPWMDLPAFFARYRHMSRGLNLVFPVLPLHGPRRPEGMPRGGLMSYQVVDTVLGLTQGVWDVRRLLAWMSGQGATHVGLHGLSIGAYIGSLVASLHPLDLLLAGIPVADIPALFNGHTPHKLRDWIATRQPTPAQMESLFRPVSPLALLPQVPHAQRFVYAGRVDRITPPEQARLLWEAWERPTIRWFEGGHVSFRFSSEVFDFVDQVLDKGGLYAAAGRPR
jgi:hypothetical protein